MSSLCTYRNYSHHRSIFATANRPSELSWFSVALKNLSNESESKERSDSPESQPQKHATNSSPSDSANSEPVGNAADHPESLASHSKMPSHASDESKQSQLLPTVSPQASITLVNETNETTLNSQTTSSPSPTTVPISYDKPSTPQEAPSTPPRPSALAVAPTPAKNLSSPPLIPQRKAPPPPVNGTDNTQRRSLTTMFLENKKKQEANEVDSSNETNSVEMNSCQNEHSGSNEKAEFDRLREMASNDSLKPSDIVSSHKSESTTINRPNELQTALEQFSKKRITDDTTFDDDCHSPYPTIQPYSSQLAGDGNPVRYSLINLVSEEDVPMLLEAMAEKLEFVFEDLLSTPSSSNDGIIHDTLKRQQRRKNRNVSRINFKLTPPSVFAYPDESSALEEAEWYPGEDITFDQYQKICKSEKERCEQQRREMNKWRSSILANHNIDADSALSAHPISPTASDFELGVTSRISYDSPPIFTTNNDFTPNSVSLIAGK